jgi:hypothetical protein
VVRWETRYARSDGVSIAYQVVGEGPTDLILVPGFVSHVEVAWEEPRLAHFLGRLAAFSRLIVFDKRGTGMSDPVDSVPSSRRSAGRPGGRSDCETAKQGLATRRSVADSGRPSLPVALRRPGTWAIVAGGGNVTSSQKPQETAADENERTRAARLNFPRP